MAKTIKFNLNCDGYPVRTLEDLQNHFSVQDVWGYYQNGLLQRWLDVRGYETETKAIAAVTNKDAMTVMKELIRIFKVETDTDQVEQSLYILKYEEERQKRLAAYQEESHNMQQIIRDYHSGYARLATDILKHPDDAARIKANIRTIVEEYPKLLKLNHRNLFYLLKEKSALALMCCLMNDTTRAYYLPVNVSKEKGKTELDTEYNADKAAMYKAICDLVEESSFSEKLGNNLLRFSGQTDGYWKDLAAKGKKYIIIKMESRNYVRSAGQTGGDLSYDEVAKKFVILNGIDYKSAYPLDELWYMEV